VARPSNAQLEQGDLYGTLESVRLCRKHMRRTDAALVKLPVGSDKAAPLIALLFQYTAELRAAELHEANLRRNPPTKGKGTTKTGQ
jgi:hypothetical protein